MDKVKVFKENIETVSVAQSVDNNETKHGNIQFESQQVLVNESFVDIPMNVLPDGNEAKGLKQIIYVYEDHTFEVYNLRK